MHKTKGKYSRSLTGKHAREFKLWLNMKDRCSVALQSKMPSYQGCYVDEAFLDFDYFVDWCNAQIGFGLDDAQLDKDLLVPENKRYGPDTCVFLPRKVNQVINKRAASRGSLPIGVSRSSSTSKPFIAQCNRGATRWRASFDTAEKAFLAYKQEKERYIKHLVEVYKDNIDERAIAALLAYEVRITD